MFTRLHLSPKTVATLPRIMASRTKATAAFAKVPSPSRPFLNGTKAAKFGALGLGLGATQYYLGSAENFFEHKFITSKKPEDLADFYGTEDFMEIFCVLPFMVKFMMRGAEFDDEGHIHAWGLLGPGELEVSIDFDEEEIDTNGDGEPDTLAWFNKKERFRDTAPSFLGGFTLWEMCQNFGYHRRDDGTCEVYHSGEKFNGFFLMRVIFELHSRYVFWATKKYVNSEAFGSDDMDTEREEQRQNVPLHVFKEFIADLTREVEKAKTDPAVDAKKQQELEVTVQRLKTLSVMDHEASMPQLRTLKSRKTVSRVQLVVDDKETTETIRTAMKQIGSAKGQMHEPVKEMRNLVRRTTMGSKNRKSQGELEN
jgi:hypothetical protein